MFHQDLFFIIVPQINPSLFFPLFFPERMNRTLLDQFFRVAGRQTWYIEPEEIQRDLDTFINHYNLERTHQGYRLKGRTPAQALRDALGADELPPFMPSASEETTMTDAA